MFLPHPTTDSGGRGVRSHARRPFARAALVLLAVAGWVLAAGCASSSGKGGSDRGTGAAGEEAEIELRSRAFAHYGAGLSSELADQPNLALEHFEQAVEADPDQEPLSLLLAQRYLRARQATQAVEVLERAAKQKGASARVDAWLGFAALQAGDTNGSIRASREAARKDRGFMMAYQGLIPLLMATGEEDDALRELSRLRRLESDDLLFWFQVAELHVAVAGARSKAAENARIGLGEVLERIETLEPERNAAMRQRLAELHRAAGELPKAEEYYLELLRERPSVLVRERLAEIYLRTDRREKAVEQYEAIRSEMPASPQVHYILGGLAAEGRELDKAEGYYRQAIRLQPSFEPAYYELAVVQLNQDQPEESLKLLGQARSRFGTNFVGEFYSALSYGRLKDYTNAVAAIRAAEAVGLESQPGRLTDQFYFQAGALHERAGRIAEAEAYFRRALEGTPDFAEALNYLGYMWAERGINLKEAHRMIVRAVKAEPENAAFLDSLGWVLFKMGRRQEALDWLIKAVTHAEEPDPVLYDHLGDIYDALDRTDQARAAWEKSAALEPNDEVLKKLGRSGPSNAAARQ